MAYVSVQELLNIAPKLSDLRQKPQGVRDITTDNAAIPKASHKRIRYDYDQEVDVLILLSAMNRVPPPTASLPTTT